MPDIEFNRGDYVQVRQTDSMQRLGLVGRIGEVFGWVCDGRVMVRLLGDVSPRPFYPGELESSTKDIRYA